ncbi:YciI family protein [Fodinicola acaciae]|uniref:YciI family protein n=1 Tax=Fodinicola acaciae TaxID=2681555 RepID=UPI0013D414A0|nr:YciI family protein [Fodinicola acaciae]
MQYLFSVIDDQTTTPTQSELAATGAFNARLQADGYWVFADGLASPRTATVVDNRGSETNEPVFTDGPFLESKEFLGGLYIIQAPDLDVALKLAAEASKHCNRRIEVRPFHSEEA